MDGVKLFTTKVTAKGFAYESKAERDIDEVLRRMDQDKKFKRHGGDGWQHLASGEYVMVRVMGD